MRISDWFRRVLFRSLHVGACNRSSCCSQTAPYPAQITLQRADYAAHAIRQCARHHPRLLANGKGPLMVSANYKVEISSHLLMRDAHAALWNPRSESTRWGKPPSARSEEHTSELQSLMRISYAVFCLKKKKKAYQQTTKT